MTRAGGRRSRLFGGGAAALAIVVLGLPAAAQAQDSAARSRDAWHRVAQRAPAPGHRVAVAPRNATSFNLDRALLAAEARRAPRAGAGSPVVLSIPQPDGSFARFEVTRGTTLSSKLAAKHPKIRDYVGVGVDDPSASLSLVISPQGAFAAIRGRNGTSYVEPRYRDDATAHVAFAREDLPNTEPLRESEEIARLLGSAVPRSAPRPGPGEDVPLRTYRLALINDQTYATFIEAAGGQVLTAKAELMARVNQIYRQDLGITMTLIPQTDALNLNTDAEAIQPNGPCGGAACYTSTQLDRCSDSTLTRTTIVAGQIAGARNYDIGHLLLGDGGGGLAAPGAGDFNKAEGCTGGGGSPTGDAFGVDFVAHEMGHQFGAHHTYNGTSGDCTTRIDASAMEPGSGSTIMAYAGLCGADNLQPHTDPYFSQRSQTQMYGWVDAPAVDRENPPLSSVQRVSLRDFDGTDSFGIAYGAGAPETITNGTNYTLDGIQTAIEAAIGGGATVTVTNWQGEAAGALDQNGFTVTFDSDVNEPQLVLSNFSGASGFVGDAVVGGPRNNGGTVTTTPNKAPAVQTAAGFTIPARTPFTLTATGSDANPADTLTYLWEQSDPGTGRALGTEPGPFDPLFRVFGVAQRTDTGGVYNSTPKNATTTNPARDFPDVAQVMADNTDAVNDCGSVTTDAGNDCWSEYLPKVNRTMTFRVTARDGNPEAGGTGFVDRRRRELPDGARGLDAERRQRVGAPARGRPDRHGADPHRGRRKRLLRRLTRAALVRPQPGALAGGLAVERVVRVGDRRAAEQPDIGVRDQQRRRWRRPRHCCDLRPRCRPVRDRRRRLLWRRAGCQRRELPGERALRAHQRRVQVGDADGSRPRRRVDECLADRHGRGHHDSGDAPAAHGSDRTPHRCAPAELPARPRSDCEGHR